MKFTGMYDDPIMPEAYAAAAAAKTVAQMYLARMQDPDTHEEP